MIKFHLSYKSVVVCLLAVAITACALPGNELAEGAAGQPEAGEQDNVSADESSALDGSGLDGSFIDDSGNALASPIAGDVPSARELLEETDTPLANRTVYFEFDSAKLTDESLAVLEVHGNFVASNGEVNVRLEGHTDERGSREYNISLGDRRAQSVRRVLLFQGASADQIETVSYGEEQPAMSGHTEEAWSKNRRVELEYQVTQ